ncbi:hypothetical protein BH10ACT11_BH10ACT11_12000 [soil metagenome]
MKRTSALVAACVASIAIFVVAFASVAAAAQPKLKVSASQEKAVAGKLEVKVKGKVKKTTKLKATSTTFDDPKPKTLTKSAKLKPGKKKVTLKLTGAGKKAVASCTARKITVKGKGVKTGKADLLRNTGACKPGAVDTSQSTDCDFIGAQDGSLCLLPFPDDYYTVKDSTTSTGRRIDLHNAGMPANNLGTHIDAEPYNLNDGFSPGQVITLKVPGLDRPQALANTDPIPVNDLSRNESQISNEPIVVIDTKTHKRVPIWAEIDSHAPSVAGRAVLIHGATEFKSGHRYIVAMRNLKDANDKTLKAPAGFRYYRDHLPMRAKAISKQGKRFGSIFRTLRNAKIKRSNLYLAWDFTVSSDQNIADRVLHMRDDAFATALNDSTPGDGIVQGNAPAFNVTTVDVNPDTELARRVRGTFTVPCYLTNGCEAPARFDPADLAATGLPAQHGSYTANFDCIIPHAAVDDSGHAPGRPSLYGHGLLGTASETHSGPQRSLAQAHDFVFCGTDEIGFADEDFGNTVGILQDFSKFPELTDRTQQGLLNELFLGRLMDTTKAQGGFLSDPAFHVDPNDVNSADTIDTSQLYYNGNSQGGILGGALTAISPDVTRASLGVPAMGYSTLLSRSVDFDTYELILNPSYPNELSRPLVLSLVQMLWDRSEPNGFAHRMTTNPLPNTPPHKVLMNLAFGDHQVTNYQAEVEARTIGAKIHTPIVYSGRWPNFDAGWNIPAIASYPYTGSAIVYWDGGPTRPGAGGGEDPDNGLLGTDVMPLENLANESGDDPHGLPRADPKEQQMVSDFLQPDAQSNITDTCTGLPCYDGGFTGP